MVKCYCIVCFAFPVPRFLYFILLPTMLFRAKFQKLFDPRCRRAASKGAAGQAEHVTGTHLYAYLQDAAIAPTSRSSSINAVGAFTAAEAPEEELCKVTVEKKCWDLRVWLYTKRASFTSILC